MTRIGPLALCAALAVPPALSRAEDQPFWTQEGWPDASEVEAQPPQEAPPAPPVEGQAQPAPAAGQWVHTQQYGWIWMPYSDTYTQVPANGYGEPLAYVYYPAYGWTWLAAPWIWGIGPWPVFGVWGPARYGWYAHGWWRSPGRWRYAPGYAWGGHRGWAPGYGGGRVGITRPAPYGRGAGHGGYARGSAARGSAVAPSRAFSAGGRSWGGGAPSWSGGRGGGGGAHVVAPRGNGGGGGGGGRGGGHASGRHR